MSDSVSPSVPKSTAKPAESVVEEIVEDVEHIFTPKPGGMIDTWHKEKARREAAQREAQNAAEKVQEGAAYAVKVTQLQPEVTATNIITVQPGAIAQILPKAPFRYRATIIVVTAASSIILAANQSQALGNAGFPLPTGIPMVVNSRAQLFGSNSGASAVQVAVLSESYAAEQ